MGLKTKSFLIKSKASGWAVGTINIRSFFLGMVIPEIMLAASGDSMDAISFHKKNPYISGGFTSNFQNSFDLIERRVAREHSLAQNKLSQNAANRPHIHSLRILS